MDATLSIRAQTQTLLRKAPLSLAQSEIDAMELADFGLGDIASEGAQIITLFSTNRVAGKVIVLLPGQTLPEHQHVDRGNHVAKQEILRVVYGTLYLYVPGPGSDASRIPIGKESFYCARTRMELAVNRQAVIEPGTPHWFTPGALGCVLYSFSSAALDQSEMFTDPGIVR